LFHELYTITTIESSEEYDIELINKPKNGFYEVSGEEEKVARNSDPRAMKVPAEKSFHVDTYCFDSNPERDLFWRLLQDKKVKEVYFTGMLTHGQSDFYVQYIDPESHTVRSYYPDFLVKKDDDTYVIIEVKGEHQMDDSIVKAKKDYAEQLAVASGMSYKMIGGQSVGGARYHELFN
jgi:hypothetical protein